MQNEDLPVSISIQRKRKSFPDNPLHNQNQDLFKNKQDLINKITISFPQVSKEHQRIASTLADISSLPIQPHHDSDSITLTASENEEDIL